MFLSRNKKNNVYPCKPQFNFVKVGFKGVKIIKACFRDGSHGGQKKRYKDTLKASLDFNIPTESWEQIAQDRTKWRGLIKRGAGEYEAKRISEAEQKRAQRKARAKASPTELSSSDLSCSICNRQFRAKIGLISHLRTHI